MTLVVRQAKGLAIARKATSLQVAVAGETYRGETQEGLDGPMIAGEIARLALELKTELEMAAA